VGSQDQAISVAQPAECRTTQAGTGRFKICRLSLAPVSCGHQGSRQRQPQRTSRSTRLRERFISLVPGRGKHRHSGGRFRRDSGERDVRRLHREHYRYFAAVDAGQAVFHPFELTQYLRPGSNTITIIGQNGPPWYVCGFPGCTDGPTPYHQNAAMAVFAGRLTSQAPQPPRESQPIHRL
jgi:hypothetical protein